MENLPPNVESKFRLVHIVSRRAEQLVQGARPKMESRHAKVTRVALDEVNADLIGWQLAEVAPVETDALQTDPIPVEG